MGPDSEALRSVRWTTPADILRNAVEEAMLDQIGGEPLAGSGFEAETPDTSEGGSHG